MARIIWHGHSCFTLITDDGVRIMFDPWLDENPAADITTDDVEALDYILVSHGHFDHFADAIGLAKKTGATLVSSYEIVSYAESKGVRSGHGMSIGGGYRFPFGYVKMTPALHGPGVAGDEGPFAAMPGGWWLDMNGKRLYHAGDTALIMEMQLLAGKVDVALLPIGDNYTMGPEDAAAAVGMIRPKVVIPMHYNTFDGIAQDVVNWAQRVHNETSAQPIVLDPGGTHTLS